MVGITALALVDLVVIINSISRTKYSSAKKLSLIQGISSRSQGKKRASFIWNILDFLSSPYFWPHRVVEHVCRAIQTDVLQLTRHDFIYSRNFYHGVERIENMAILAFTSSS